MYICTQKTQQATQRHSVLFSAILEPPSDNLMIIMTSNHIQTNNLSNFYKSPGKGTHGIKVGFRNKIIIKAQIFVYKSFGKQNTRLLKITKHKTQRCSEEVASLCAAEMAASVTLSRMSSMEETTPLRSASAVTRASASF